jgi:predicted RNase H-like HicB family nuclease
MTGQLTLEHWTDGDWIVGRLVEVPGVFSQGATLDELRENIRDAYDAMVNHSRMPAPTSAEREPLLVPV